MADVREVWDNTAHEIAEWCGGKVVTEYDALDPSKTYLAINVRCRDGNIYRASQGFSVIQLDDGTFEVL